MSENYSEQSKSYNYGKEQNRSADKNQNKSENKTENKKQNKSENKSQNRSWNINRSSRLLCQYIMWNHRC